MPLEPADPGQRSFADHNRALIRRGERNRERFLAAFDGSDVSAACAAAGVTRTTYGRWRRDFPDFKHAVEKVRAGALDDGDAVAAARAIATGGMEAFGLWRQKYLGMASDIGHQRIADAITRAEVGRITMVLAPPGTGKTTTICDWTTMRVATDPNHRVTYVHQADDNAKDFITRLRNRLTNTDNYGELIDRYGPFRESGAPGWDAHRITHAKRSADHADPTVKARSILSKVQGIRSDRLLIDDIQDVESLGQTDRLLAILRQTYFTRVVGVAPLVMCGNRVGPGDVWEAVLSDDGLAGLVDLVTIPALDPSGKSNFPSVMDEGGWALKRRLVGEDVWWRNYMQVPRGSSEGAFKTADLVACLDRRFAGGRRPDGEWEVLTGVDPALAGGTAVVSVAWNAERIVPIDATWREGLPRYEAIYEIILDHVVRHRPLDVVFEDQALQKGLARDERIEAMSREHGFRVLEHVTSGRKFDPVVGVGAMASSFIRREVSIPAHPDRPGEPAREVAELWDQLERWTAAVPTKLLTQDCVMALWFAWLRWRELVKSARSADDDQWRAKPMAAPPVAGRTRWLPRQPARRV